MGHNDKSLSRPAHLSVYAEACLQALARRGLGDKLSLGGGLGLLHYLDYRPTHDVDAWWAGDTTPQERQAISKVIEEILRSWGEVDVRAWGEVTSIELSRAGEKVFSFQIAHRSAQLEPSKRAPWVNVRLDSLPDLVASKMVALVERGAPRDFRDIHAVCMADLFTPGECWQLWAQRQRLSGSDTDWARARLAVATHLKRIALHRPLAQISDPQRSEAAQVRDWYQEVFLNAIPT
jgi:hypothetical protein